MTTAMPLSSLNVIRKYGNGIADRSWVAAKVDKAGATRTLSVQIVEMNSTFDSADESKMHERTESCRWCGFLNSSRSWSKKLEDRLELGRLSLSALEPPLNFYSLANTVCRSIRTSRIRRARIYDQRRFCCSRTYAKSKQHAYAAKSGRQVGMIFPLLSLFKWMLNDVDQNSILFKQETPLHHPSGRSQRCKYVSHLQHDT